MNNTIKKNNNFIVEKVFDFKLLFNYVLCKTTYLTTLFYIYKYSVFQENELLN